MPVIADPSHGIGIRKYVDKIALAAIIAGADGVILETHPVPEKAISDNDQTLSFSEMQSLKYKIDNLLKIR